VRWRRKSMPKIDFKKTLKHLYGPSRKGFALVTVPSMQFLMVDGHGDPNKAPEYTDAVEALYAVSFRLKFLSKSELDKDYVVAPLEGLWWAEDMETFTSIRDKDAWDWTMMIMQPEWITHEAVSAALEQVQKKPLPALEKLRLEDYAEGLSVQTMHIGAYDDEGPVLSEMHSVWIPENGYVQNGRHHEIYISDPRRIAADKLRTVLRQPIKRL
jgi:hypothetical protein